MDTDEPDIDEAIAQTMAMIRFMNEHPDIAAQMPVSVEQLRASLGTLMKSESEERKAQEALAKGEADLTEAIEDLEAVIEQHITSGGDPTNPIVENARRALKRLRRKK